MKKEGSPSSVVAHTDLCCGGQYRDVRVDVVNVVSYALQMTVCFFKGSPLLMLDVNASSTLYHNKPKRKSHSVVNHNKR